MEEFRRPPEAPVFEPTEEEFADPIAYVATIRPIVEKTGICKIRPPANWQPPFALDVDNFQFSTRIQQLNELEARSRVKLNFLDAMARFWELQGATLKVPIVDKQNLDLHRLYKVVNEEGGFARLCREKKWSVVSRKMGYNPTHSHASVGSLLRSHYEKTILPYVSFVQRAVQKKDECKERDVPVETLNCSDDPDFTVRKSKRYYGEASKMKMADGTTEVKKLQFKSPGPKTMASGLQPKTTPPETRASKDECLKGGVVPDVETIYCLTCRGGDAEEYLLLCDGCNAAYHTFCLSPPLSIIPIGEWLCPSCLARECHILQEEVFGFEQNEKMYTLETFGQMADKFKAEYFNRPPHLVPVDEVEKTFWRLVTSLDDEVAVEYGADLHTANHGSGFPWKDRIQSPEDEMYSKSPWNLNNLPNLPNSVLSQIHVNISGMKVPWMGEPKTWYGVPGGYAEQFEQVMKRTAPELFEHQPDLLHQLVTLLSPTVLMENNIPVVRTDQHAGEFMVTFPRAYHAGFNQGFNLAEAVNFAPADWLSFGRHCIENYKRLKRHSVFSHEELLCRMAVTAENIDPDVAVKTAEELGVVLEQEKVQREIVKQKGVVCSEHELFELLPDDGRVCCVCNSTCFLSAVTSPAKPGKFVCLKHASELCGGHWTDCCLRYRYTVDELKAMKRHAEKCSNRYLEWKKNVEAALDAPLHRRPLIADFRELISQASIHNLRQPDLIIEMEEAVVEAERCAAAVHRLISKKHKKKRKQEIVTLEDLKEFVVQLDNLACEIPEAQTVKELVAEIERFKRKVDGALSQESPNAQLLQSLLADGEALNIPLPELDQLETELKLAHWLNDINTMFDSGEPVRIDTVEDLLREASAISSHPGVNKAVVKLQEILEFSKSWESKAQAALEMKPCVKASYLEALLQEASQFITQLPAVSRVKSALGKANMWIQEAKRLQNQDRYPWLLELEGLLTRGRSIPVHLPDMAQIESLMNAAKGWRDQVSKLFLKRNSTWTCLLEVLLPRVSVELDVKSRKRRDWERIVGDGSHEVKEEIAQVVNGETIEWEEMRKFRERNQARRRCHELSLTKASDLQQRFCVCKRFASPNMIECQLCRDWFHNKCVLSSYCRGLSKAVERTKFLCGSCIRTRRPGLDMVNLMVLNLKKVPVLMPEAIALQRLANRATEWQQRARQALALAQDSLAQSAKETELLVGSKGKKDSSYLKSDVEGSDDCAKLEKDRRSGEPEVDIEAVSPLSASEPAQPVNLREDLRGELEELMFEGDLLEVTLDETQQIWQLLQSGHIKDSCVQPILIGEERVDFLMAAPENARKRKRCEPESKRRRKRVHRPKTKKEPSSYQDDEDDNDDEEEQCAAFECLMPASEEVQWIQCDQCHEWYHFACVELTKEAAQALDTYVCTNCACTV